MNLFVYGSLKRGFSNHAFLAGQRFLGPARTSPVYHLYDTGGYPGAVLALPGQGHAVEGELWEIDDACQRRVDFLEGTETGHYEIAICALDPGTTPPPETTWIYLYARDTAKMPTVGSTWTKEMDRQESEPLPDTEPTDQL